MSGTHHGAQGYTEVFSNMFAAAEIYSSLIEASMEICGQLGMLE